MPGNPEKPTNVVIIEHRTGIRRELTGVLVDSGFNVVAASDLEDTIRAIQSRQPDILLAGELVEAPSREELCHELRHLPATASAGIIALADGPDIDSARSVLDADEVIGLPIDAADLIATIERVRWATGRIIDPDEMRHRLRRPAELLMRVFERAIAGYFISDREGVIVAASPGLERITGFPLHEVIGETFQGLSLDVDAAHTPGDTLQTGRFTLTLTTSNWRTIPVELETTEIRLAGLPCIFGAVREISEQRVADSTLTGNLIAALTDGLGDAVLTVDSEGKITFANVAAERRLGLSSREIAGHDLVELVVPADQEIVQSLISFERAGGKSSVEVHLREGDGTDPEVRLVASDVVDHPMFKGRVVTIRGESAAPDRDADFDQASAFYRLYDQVTALPNRQLFLDRLDHAIERLPRYKHLISCMVISIDGFDELAASTNPSELKLMLASFSRRLHRVMRDGDTAARLGDNEFAILAEGIGGAAEARAISERVVAALQQPFESSAGSITLSASIGIAISQPTGQQTGNLLRDATAARDYARDAGGARAVVFENRMRDTVMHSLRLEHDLEGALQRGELQVFYQPEVELATEQIAGVEALVRWEHPRHGLILPGEFLAIAEETGLIVPIGWWILADLCRQVQEWRDRYPAAADLVAAANISRAQIDDPDFTETLAGILTRTGLPPSHLRLEFTATDAGELDRLLSSLQGARDLGVQIGLQEFDLQLLERDAFEELPVNVVKVDRAQAGGAIAMRVNSSRTEPVAHFAFASGLEIIVTGIETAQHLARARIFGHKLGQGYYFSRPAPPQTIEFQLGAPAGQSPLLAPNGVKDYTEALGAGSALASG